MSDKAHIVTDAKLEEMEKHLTKIYSDAQKDIQKKADEYFDKFKKADEEKRKLVKQGKLTDKEYQQWRQNKIMYGKRFTAMKEDIAKQLLNVNQIATAYINGELPEVYALNYNALADSVDGVGGYSFTLVDADTVRELATTDKSLLPFRELDPAKDIPWNMKAINSEVLQGIIQGESIPDISKRIMNVQSMNKAAAIRSARTIVTGAENKGRMDSYKRAEADGIILQKEWLSSDQPGRTRDWHLPHSFESLVVDIDKPFVNGMGKIMFPGDPSADGANVYNCRCSMASVVKGFKKAQVEKAMEQTYNEEQVKETLHFIEENSRSKNYEVGTIIDRNGNILESLGGSSHQVNISSEIVPLLKDNIFTHNHPSGGCFSRDDVFSFIETGLFEVRASAPNSTVYSLKKGIGENNGDDMLQLFKIKKTGDRRKAQGILQEKLDSGEISPEEWSRKGFDLVVRLQEQDIEDFLTKNASKFGYVFTKGEI